MTNSYQKTSKYFKNNQQQYIQDLEALVRIPSVSFPGFSESIVQQSAQATADLLKKRGFQNIEMLEIEGAHPAVYADYLVDPKLPTMLLYAHHDVQPGGSEEGWISPPFEPTIRNNRLYGRGTADDKGGIVAYTAALDSLLQNNEKPSYNLKVFIEGEEETGSSHINQFLEKFGQKLSADSVVVLDSSNFREGLPSLTTSLRGMMAIEVTVSTLKQDVHSGMWGGPLPDAALALSKMIASLQDDSGKLTIEGIYDDVLPMTDDIRHNLKRLNATQEEFREQSGLLDQVQMFTYETSPYEKVWYEPQISINAIQASSKEQARNIHCQNAWTRIGLRLVPNMDPVKTFQQIKNHLIKKAPWGAQVDIKEIASAPAWYTETSHPMIQSTLAALEVGYGKAPVVMGCGGSIPFVERITNCLGGIPALIIGVADPATNAHGENESLSLGEWQKATLSLLHLFLQKN